MGSGNYIPMIDAQDFPAQSEKLLEACEEWGCFRVTNHGIPAALMSEMKSVARSLFDRPLEIKQRNTNAISDRGYVAPPHMPLYEGMGVYDPASAGTVDSFCSQLEASPHQRETILKYSQAIQEFAVNIGLKIAESTGLAIAGGDLFRGWPCQFRLNKYNCTPESVGLTAGFLHSDVGFLAIVQVDEVVSGLEVMDKNNGSYIAVDPFPGTLFVILGDMAKAWSNGRFHSVKHRMQCREGSVRLSIVLFVLGPKDEEQVEAPPQLVESSGRPRLYVPFTFEHYRMLRNSTRYVAGEALELLRATNTT